MRKNSFMRSGRSFSPSSRSTSAELPKTLCIKSHLFNFFDFPLISAGAMRAKKVKRQNFSLPPPFFLPSVYFLASKYATYSYVPNSEAFLSSTWPLLLRFPSRGVKTGKVEMPIFSANVFSDPELNRGLF